MILRKYKNCIAHSDFNKTELNFHKLPKTYYELIKEW